VFSIGSDGALTLTGAIRTGSQPMAITLASGNAPVSYTPKFAYAVNHVSNNVSTFSIDSTSGTLTEISGSPFAAGNGPFGIVVDPSRRFAFVTDEDDNTVSGYQIDAATGAFSPTTGSPHPTGANPATPAIDPSGRYLYVPNYAANSLSVFAINSSDGSLTPVSGSTLAPMNEPVAAVVDPTGRFLFVASQGGTAYGVCTPSPTETCGVSAYTIDRSSGALTPVYNSPYPAGPEPSSLTIDPSGRYLYVANESTTTTFQFWIDPNSGALTKIGSTPPVSGAAAGIAAEPLGRYVYTTDGLGWLMDPAGTLSQIAGPPFAMGSVPFSITADVSGRFVYVADQGGGVYAYTIDSASGQLQPMTGSPFPAGTAPIAITTTGVHQ
jgi:6-phosphogluconolactonase (cycloisomerase 2 family)